MLSKLKAFFAFLYRQFTLIVAAAVTTLVGVSDYIDQLLGLNWASVLDQATAAKVVLYAALTKIVAKMAEAVINSLRSA